MRMERFGGDHIGAIAALVGACAAAAWLGRRLRGTPAALILGRALAVVLLAAQIADPFIAADLGWLSWQNSLPLELCDASAFAAIVALWSHRQAAFELAYFWGLAGAAQAVLSPDITVAFPELEFLRFFALHIGIVAGVFYVGPGLGLRPRRGAEWRALGWTLVYVAFIGLIDFSLDANYMYLRRKPAASPLDWFGPWPWYLFGGIAMAGVLYFLLALPYRLSGARSNSRR